jgi:GPH family glycoside/pentoside/hexuronide:cation symporter
LLARRRGATRRCQDAGRLLAASAAVLGDAAFRRLLAVFVANGIAAALPATLVLFFVADVLQAEAWSGAFLALYFIAGAVASPAG